MCDSLTFHVFPFISIVFIKIHEYSNKIIFISDHKVIVKCLTITLIPSSVMFHFMFVHYTFSSVWVAEWPPFGK